MGRFSSAAIRLYIVLCICYTCGCTREDRSSAVVVAPAYAGILDKAAVTWGYVKTEK